MRIESQQYQRRDSGLYVPGDHDKLIKRHAMPGVGVPSSAGASSMNAVLDQLPTIPNEVLTFDLKYSTVTTSGGNITDVSDLSGNGNDLTTDTGSNPPADVTSYATLGGRRSASFDRSNSEAWESASFTALSAPYSWWLCFTLDDLADSWLMMSLAGTYDEAVKFDTSSPDSWEVHQQYTVERVNATTPATATSYLMVCVMNDGSTELYINNVAQGCSFGTKDFSLGCNQVWIGGDDNWFAYSEIHVTAGGVTDDAMSASTRADLETWRSTYAA